MSRGLCKLSPVSLSSSRYKKEHGIFLISDLHLGASNLDEDLLRKELDDALVRKDRIAINGDVFDLILTRDAKRYNPTAIHKSIQGRDDIVNASIDLAMDILKPVAHLIDMIGVGNHETAYTKNSNTDPVLILIQRLNAYLRGKHQIQPGGYTGILSYEVSEYIHSIFYWHGSGGGRGLGGILAEFIPKGFFVEGADTLWFGHRHIRAVSQLEKFQIDLKGNVSSRYQWLVRSGGYLSSYDLQKAEEMEQEGRQGNYAADALLQPAGRGGIRLVLENEGISRVEVR